jgi:hypothetical protein
MSKLRKIKAETAQVSFTFSRCDGNFDILLLSTNHKRTHQLNWTRRFYWKSKFGHFQNSKRNLFGKIQILTSSMATKYRHPQILTVSIATKKIGQYYTSKFTFAHNIKICRCIKKLIVHIALESLKIHF